MFNRLLAGLFRHPATSHRSRPVRRCRLGIEQLETREVPSVVPAADGVQSQTLANPSINGNGIALQYITAGSYQTIANQTVTVDAAKTGLFQLGFQAQAYSGVSNRVGLRYLIDGQIDPNDAVIRAGTANDLIEDIGTTGWQTLYLTRLLTLAPGTHTITVQAVCTNQAFTLPQGLAICSSTLNVVGFDMIDTVPAADGAQAQAVASPAVGRPGQQDITAGGYRTVASQTVTVGPRKTGRYDLTFQAQAVTALAQHVSVRYLIDGKIDPLDLALRSNGPGADVSEDFNNGAGGGQWHTLMLMQSLVLGAGTHTVTVQVRCDNPGGGTQDMVVYTPVLSLVGYNFVVGSQRAAAGVPTQMPASPVPGYPGQQNITAGTFQTVAAQTLPVTSPRTGLYQFTFQAQAVSADINRVYVRYIIDGKRDANDVGVMQSASSADAVEDFFSGGGNPVWHTVSLTRLLSLTPGTHTVAVQVYCTMQSPLDGPDLVVVNPYMHLMGFNNITPASSTGGTGGGTGNSTFSFDPASGVLTINGTTGNDTFRFVQATVQAADGTLTTGYTITLNGASASYTSAQLSRVVVNGNGGVNTATLYTRDTYLGADGLTHETAEQASLGAGGGTLQKPDATGAFVNFLRLAGYAKINVFMGQADSALLYDSAGKDTFTGAGLSATMAGTGYYNSVNGAGMVTGFSSTGQDTARQYDGSGASTLTVLGNTSSTMTGTDNGLAFTNKAMGFKFTYGISRHAGNTAELSDSLGTDVFVGQAATSYMYSATAKGVYTMYNQVTRFDHVNATSTDGKDASFNYAPAINTVTGFRRVAG